MKLHIIKRADDAYLSFVRGLYEESFRSYERRNWDQLMALLIQPEMTLAAVTEIDMEMDERTGGGLSRPVGLIISWEFNDWCYIEHFAIDPALRGRQYGTRIIQFMQGLYSKLVLETSLPDSEDNERRVRFYERLGLEVCPFSYAQPPYRRGEAPVPMVLMSKPAIREKDEYSKISGLIHDRVYERFYV